MRKPFLLSVIGLQNSGKTRLVVQLVRAFTTRGYRVAVLKHDGHADAMDSLRQSGAGEQADRPSNDWQKAGSDTELSSAAGAVMTMVAGGGQSLLHMCRDEQTHGADNVTRLCARMVALAEAQQMPLDVIVVEGYKQSELPKLAVIRTREHVAWLRDNVISDLVGVVMPSDLQSFTDPCWQVYDGDDLEHLLTEIENRINHQLDHQINQ